MNLLKRQLITLTQIQTPTHQFITSENSCSSVCHFLDTCNNTSTPRCQTLPTAFQTRPRHPQLRTDAQTVIPHPSLITYYLTNFSCRLCRERTATGEGKPRVVWGPFLQSAIHSHTHSRSLCSLSSLCPATPPSAVYRYHTLYMHVQLLQTPAGHSYVSWSRRVR